MTLIIVHRLLQSLVLPPLNSVLIIVLGFCLLKKYRRISKLIIGFGILTFYIQATPYFAYRLNKSIELPPLKDEQIKTVQAIVVLGGGLNAHSYEYPVKAIPNTETLTRLNYAAYLARQYPNLPIITSGGYTGTHYTEGKVMRYTLITSYHVTNPISVEDSSRNTDENAKYVAKILQEKGIKKVAVVSQAYHLRRACMVFRKYGIEPVPASTDYIYYLDAVTPILAFIPTASAMRFTSRALHEIIGYWFYTLQSV
ncbi:MAG TPA: YdcF family protein [Aquella sp.]|nr:YdcF family protein [Aquella sp.]